MLRVCLVSRLRRLRFDPQGRDDDDGAEKRTVVSLEFTWDACFVSRCVVMASTDGN